MPRTKTSINADDFLARVNSDLVGKYIASRRASLPNAW
jgi:hypothetical protein